MTATVAAPAGANPFWPAFAALVGGAAAMGVSPILVRLADVGPLASAFYRVALALPLLYGWMRAEEARSGRPGLQAARFSPVIVVMGLLFAGDLVMWHLAILNTTVANATFFATTAPLWVMLLGWAFYRTRVPRTALAGLGLCLVGGLALVGQSFALAPEHLLGDALAEATAVFFGGYFLALEKARVRYRAGQSTFYMTVIAASVLLVFAVADQLVRGQPLLPGSLKGVVVLLGLAWVSHAGGQGLLAVAMGTLPAMFSSLVIFLEVVAASALAWLVLSEPVTAVQVAGGLVILAGIWIARPAPAGKRAAA